MNRIRPATPADAPELARVHVACWHESYEGLVPAALLASFTFERGLSVWRRIIGDPAAFNEAAVHVVELGERLVGFGSCGSQRTVRLADAGHDGEISSIYLLRSFQGRGIGAALMHALAADLTGRGFEAVSLWVLRDNTKARRFYDGCGGRIVGERTDVREQGTLLEVAYGWRSLAALLDRTSPSRTHPTPGSDG